MQNDLVNRVNKISRHPALEEMTDGQRKHFMGDLSENCIHGICTGVECNNCGCCSRNNDIKDRLMKLLKYYKSELKYAEDKECVNEDPEILRFDIKNKESCIRFCNEKIKECRELLELLEKDSI